MQRAFVGILLLLFASPVESTLAQTGTSVRDNSGIERIAQNQAPPPENRVDSRRCAFHSFLGTFTLVGRKGIGAYKLGGNRYIVDLVSADEDPNWWIYRATANGDPNTIGWAFARHPDCGKYSVLRYSNGAWRLFDRSDAWGKGLGESRTQTTFGESNEFRLLQQDVEKLKVRVEKLERRQNLSSAESDTKITNRPLTTEGP